MLRKLISLLLVVVAVTALPATITSAQSGGELVQVYLWKGSGPAWGYYTISPSANLGLYYYWYAKTEAQVEDFLEHVTMSVKLNNQPLFASRESAQVYWAPVEKFVQQGQPLYRAEWSAMLVPLEPGEYTIIMELSLDAAVSDGVSSGMFGPGIIQRTTNIVTVSETAGFASETPVEPVPQPDPTSNPKPQPTALPPAVAPSEPDEIYDDPAVGTFVTPSTAYWAPEEGKLVQPQLDFQPGQTLWVFGMDSTRQFYKVILDDVYLWVKKDTIGATFDETWGGTPLPNAVIQ